MNLKPLLGATPWVEGLTVPLMVALVLAPLVPMARAEVNAWLASVDIGDREGASTLVGWGPAFAVTTNGLTGKYDDNAEHARSVWFAGEDGNGNVGVLAISFHGSARHIVFNTLEGPANDSFLLYLGDGSGVTRLIYSYVDRDQPDQGVWVTHVVDLWPYVPTLALSGGNFVLNFVATGETSPAAWPHGLGTFDHVSVYGNGPAQREE